METEEFPGRIDNVSRFLFEPLFQEFFHTHFPDEAKPLAILALRIGKSRFSGNLPHFRLREVPDRKKRMRELKLIQSGKEISLVLIWIDSFEEMVHLIPDP